MDEQAQNSDLPIDPVTALSQIQDDEASRNEALRWAKEELINGQSAEELFSQMTGDGWEATKPSRSWKPRARKPASNVAW